MNSDEWYYSSRLLKGSVLLFGVTFFLITLAFSTAHWLERTPIEGDQPQKFLNTGLWVACFDGYHDENHQYDTKFHGCLYILYEEYDIIRREIQPGFFVATQFFFSLCFIGMLLDVILLTMYLLCMNEYYRVSVLRWIGIDLIVSAALGTLALIIFGVNADGRDFMPDWEYNYLSWSFGVAFLGVVLQYINGILFVIEARIIARRELSKERQQEAMGERSV